jgi:uroporphyrinogen decarboxylase
MNSRERLRAVLAGQIPDRVPVCPDISNMVPARLTGKPFWDIYVHQDPPLWKAYIDAVKYFGIDGGFEVYDFGDLFDDMYPKWESRIVHRTQLGSFVTQDFCQETEQWSQTVVVHTSDNPPATDVLPSKIGLPAIPSTWEQIEGVKQWPKGFELWKMIKKELGDHGIVGMPSGARTCLVYSTDEVCEYYDNPAKFHQRREEMLELIERRMDIISNLKEKPDFLFCGDSGSLIFQTPQMFRELALPGLKRATQLACDLGIPTHVHSCGPQTELVKIAAEETKLTVIDPLEIAPMGDCNLAELKKLYGNKIVLKGNLHTTKVMLHGSVEDVVEASKKAIDDAAEGGGFILSTGDQCGRDTPDENILAMIEAVNKYGHYDENGKLSDVPLI